MSRRGATTSLIEFTLNFSPRPANDNFNNAFVLAGLNVSTNGDNSLATSEPGEPHNGGSTSGHSVWYSWTAPSGGLEKVSASGSNFTPVIAIFTGASVSNLSIVAAGNGSVSFTPVAEITYQLAVDGSGGAFNLNLLLTPPPPNDDFASRQPLSGVRPVIHGTTYLSTSEPGEPGFYPWITSSSVWYSWVAPADGVAEISGGPKPVGVFTGNCVSNLTAVVPVGPGILTFPAVAGTEYEIAVAGGWRMIFLSRLCFQRPSSPVRPMARRFPRRPLLKLSPARLTWRARWSQLASMTARTCWAP